MKIAPHAGPALAVFLGLVTTLVVAVVAGWIYLSWNPGCDETPPILPNTPYVLNTAAPVCR